jgi:tetratricopeptide (TPR) repeat protein
VEVLLKRGFLQYIRRDFKAALDDFDLVLELEPESQEAHYDRGLAYFDQAQYDKAIADFSIILQGNPEDISARIHRALAYDKKNNRAAALSDLKQALAIAQMPEDKARVQAEIDRLTK